MTEPYKQKSARRFPPFHAGLVTQHRLIDGVDYYGTNRGVWFWFRLSTGTFIETAIPILFPAAA